MKSCHLKRTPIAGLLFLLVLALLTSPVGTARSAWARSLEQTPPSFADMADQVKHSVVNISTTQKVEGMSMQPFAGPNSPFRDFFGDDFFKHFFGVVPHGQMETHALGSGFIIDKDGLILTNNHVIEKATEIKVKLDSGKEYTAKVLGRDPKTDLALIKVKPDADFPQAVRLGNSDALRVGDWVMAVGNPFGLGHTVTVGIISAKGRIIGAGPYDDFLQTDAAINPGNSGGPLFDMNGEVVGINTAIVAQGQGIGFAIPSSMAKELLPQLKSGKIVRGWLGIMIQNITSELAKSFGLKETKGVLIADVTQGSPAEKAGLKRGDIIMKVDGKEAENANILSRMIASTPPNTKVNIEIVREEETKMIPVTLGVMPQKEAAQMPEKATTWGLQVQEITPELAEKLGLNPGEQGVVISGVESGSPASEAALQTGDVIKEVNRKGIKNLEDYNEALEKAKMSKSLLLLVKRGGGTFYVVLHLDSKE